MKRSKLVIVVVSIILSTVLFLLACATKKTPTTTEPEPTNTPSGPAPTPTNTQQPAKYNFDSTLQGWTVSTYSSPSGDDGELGITDASVSNAQVFAGTGSAALTCNFTGTLGASTSAKGAFKIDLSLSPEDLTGKTIVVRVYVPAALTQSPYNSNPYGAKVYIKTGSGWTWDDGGWNNLLTAGWNTFSYEPSGVGESDTKEVGIQISKGTGTPDWAGTIYVDEVNW